MSHWEPRESTKYPMGFHKDCGGAVIWTEPHYILGPDPDCCCSWCACSKCGSEFTQCSGGWIELDAHKEARR